MFLFDPLEQFSIDFIGSYFSNVVHSGNINLNRVFFFNFVFLFFLIYSNKSILVHNKFQKMIVLLFHFVSTTLKDSVSIKKYSFILLLYTVFLFIFISNILGMIPYSITLTSHLILTLWFSLAFFIGNNLIGICLHKENYFNLFLPEGVPIAIIPVLIIIEYISYISRIFSLAIRLFANMMSGHILLKILISFIWAIGCSSIANWFWIGLPLFIVFMVIGLEITISFLQAYVFVILISIYLNDAINLH